MEGCDAYGAQRYPIGGRFGRGRGGFWRDDVQQSESQFQGRGGDRRNSFHAGRNPNPQWRQRDHSSEMNQNLPREQQFDLRQNLSQVREQEQPDKKTDSRSKDEVQK
jgi:hypothetical protein